MSNNIYAAVKQKKDLSFNKYKSTPDRIQNALKQIRLGWQLYLLIALPVIYLLVFAYYPMYGVQIAFKNFIITKGIWGSPWIGFENFVRFFKSYQFIKVNWNTLFLSLYGLIAGFPFSIILALGLNYVNNKLFKKTIQMITYIPYFISTVVLVGMIMQLLSPRTGVINNLVVAITGESIDFIGNPKYFASIYVWSGIWQGVGFGSIIYLAVLSNIDPQLHEAAIVDGATKIQRMWHIDLPGLIPTAVILLVMSSGYILNVGFEKVFLMQNPMNLRASEVISTYIYKVSLTSVIPDYSYGTAIGLFQSVIGFILLFIVNNISKKLSETSLW